MTLSLLHLAQGNGGKAVMIRTVEVIVDIPGIKSGIGRAKAWPKAKLLFYLSHEGQEVGQVTTADEGLNLFAGSLIAD